MASFESLRDILSRLGVETPPELIPTDGTPKSGPDCEPWCRGQGYRRAGTTFLEGAAGESRPYTEVVAGVRNEYCSCPLGAKARVEQQEVARHLAERAAERNRQRFWAHTDVPPKLRGLSFESYLALPDAKPEVVAMLRRALADRRWPVLTGDVGVGKSGLAVALLAEAGAAGQSGLYVAEPVFLDRLRETYRDRRDEVDESAVMRAAIGVSVLVLDDVGTAPLKEWAREKLHRLIDERDQQQRTTIITSNLDVAGLEAHLGPRALDRIRGNATDQETGESYVISLTGPSRRGRAGRP